MIVSSSNDFRVQHATSGGALQMCALDPLRDSAWDHVVALHRDASCFHTSGWARVLHRTYKHHPFYLQFFYRRGVCLPFSDFCEPLIFEPEIRAVIRDRLLSFAQERQWHHLEIRGGKVFQLAPAAASRFYGHALDLSGDSTQMFSRFASSVRRAIRKAERSEVNAVVIRNRQAIGEFYRLHAETRRRHGLPPQPSSFFFNIYEQIIKNRARFYRSRATRVTDNCRGDLFSLR